MNDPDLDQLKTDLRALRKEVRRRGLPLSMIGKIKVVEALLPIVKEKRG
jgi:hypothetical protein